MNTYKQTAIVLSPHPDDAEYGMAIYIRNHPEIKFHIFQLSCGGEGDPTSTVERNAEAKLFWKSIPNAFYETLTTPGARVFSRNDLPRMVEIIEDFPFKYDVIFTTPTNDSNPDHQATHQLALILGRLAAVSIIEYRSPSILESWEPNFFYKVSLDDIDWKIHALNEAFKSQNHRPYFTAPHIKAFHQDYFTVKRGCDYCEMFKIIRIFGK